MKIGQIILPFICIFIGSCALIGERSPNAEYSIFTSVTGATVYQPDGKIIGQTPLILGWKEVEEFIDGRFVSFLIEKPGYYTRVVFFDATDSVNLKIDLEVDKQYREKKKERALIEIQYLQEKNSYLREQKTYLAEAVSSYKKQQDTFIKNMDLLRNRLKSSEIQLAQSKELAFGRVQASHSAQLDNVVGGGGNENRYKDIDLLLMEKKLKQCKVNSKKVGQCSKKRCPASKVKYFPPPRTNSIIRELLMAQFMIINNNYKKARTLILKLEQENPKVAALYTLLAYIETNMGRIKKAKRYLKKSLRIDKKDKMAKRMLDMISLIEKESIKR